MRLTALTLLALCACAHAASIASTVPDKKDIEKKLKEVVKEVLSKDEIKEPEPEHNEQPAPVKNIENHLKSVPSDIPVEVVVEPIYPAVKSEADKKENNEISESQESAEIKREEPDLKNPGPPQRMQHDSQHPETFEDATKKAAAQKEQWRNNPSYISLQKELQNLKSAIEAQITELQKSVQENWPVNPDAEKNEQSIKLRASVKDDPTTTTTTTSAPFWNNNPLFQGWQNIQQNWQSNFGNFNNSLNEYFANQNQSNSCNGGGGWGWGGLGGNQQSNSQSNSGTQSDEARPPGIWQQVTQNVQNFLTGGAQQPPASAQSDSPQPAQPNRPVIQAFQSAIQQAGSLFNRPPIQPAQPAGQAEPQKPQVTSEGSNTVPAKPNETQKQKPEQAAAQSGPIKQFIGNSPVVQGIAGAVQRIGQAVIPNKPREDVKSAGPDEKEEQDKGGLLIVQSKPPHRPGTGDNNDVNSSSGLGVKKAPAEIKEQPSAEPAKETPEQIQEQSAAPAEEKTD